MSNNGFQQGNNWRMMPPPPARPSNGNWNNHNAHHSSANSSAMMPPPPRSSSFPVAAGSYYGGSSHGGQPPPPSSGFSVTCFHKFPVATASHGGSSSHGQMRSVGFRNFPVSGSDNQGEASHGHGQQQQQQQRSVGFHNASAASGRDNKRAFDTARNNAQQGHSSHNPQNKRPRHPGRPFRWEPPARAIPEPPARAAIPKNGWACSKCSFTHQFPGDKCVMCGALHNQTSNSSLTTSANGRATTTISSSSSAQARAQQQPNAMPPPVKQEPTNSTLGSQQNPTAPPFQPVFVPPPPVVKQETRPSVTVKQESAPAPQTQNNGQFADAEDEDRKPSAVSGPPIDLCLDVDDQDASEKENEPPNGTTHIIFSIDFSGSMKKKDVKKANGSKIKRWDAVFLCLQGFLAEQISSSDAAGEALVSVVTFNDEAQTLLDRMPLVGDGRKVLRALETARKMHTPNGGTGFAAGFGRAKEIAFAGASQDENQNVVLVFLSDGRPGDLKSDPPKIKEPMQTTFRRHGMVYPSAARHIEAMKQKYESRFSLHLICLFNEGKKWLNYIANRYDGTLHEPDLSMDDDTTKTPIRKNGDICDDDDDSYEEDEIVEMNVKSQNTLIRERHNRAKSAGLVFSLTNTTTAGSSIRSTFESISSSVTAMRGGSRLQERQGVVLKNESPLIAYQATRMVLNDSQDKFIVPTGDTPNGRKVQVSLHPFAQGGLRNVYRMQQPGEPPQVAKESRHNVAYNERLRFHIETSKCQARALDYATKFNNKLRRDKELRKAGVPTIQVLHAEVIRLRDQTSKGNYRYLAVETALRGQYQKYNSNNGFVNTAGSLQCQVAQAYSHFSYEESDESEMVVDIQGSGYTYTDPQLHSQSKEYGRADRGKNGFTDFFRTHKCNFICAALHLKDRSASSVATTPVKNEPQN
ncbi:Myosin heavy chain kinase [Seminavis robusta]|uniref:Myosin heavy chain kinase n=1 Tax=Seminavis robusta TaxID=568900 RepID=A0A9N8ETU5_9STRA|nr:Myosin heavy chain kinase [Seminavis robusta]|eukprot:Sro1555_g282130.1 Myosin heavy chain kinase (920) ;mRNA; f:9985-13027